MYDHARRVVPELRNRSDQYLSQAPKKIGAVNVKPNGAGRFWRFPLLAEARAAYDDLYGAQVWPGKPEMDWAVDGPPFDNEDDQTFS